MATSEPGANCGDRAQESQLNYRHAFHAGNFADVVKHVALALCFERLNAKPAPYRYFDTHAGIGEYDLEGDEAERNPEWKDGVGRVWEAASGAPAYVQAALAPWLDVIRSMNADGLRHYPGSPMIASRMLRPDDAIRLCELHEPSAQLLREAMGRDRRMKIEQRDGFEALPAYLPPPERRGLVLVDPPFEVALGTRKADFEWMLKAARAALKRWPQGVYVFWRPIKDAAAVAEFDGELASMLIEDGGLAPEKILAVDLWVRELGEGPLSGAGIVIANAPFGVAEHLRAVMPWLCELMKQGPGAGWRVESPASGS